MSFTQNMSILKQHADDKICRIKEELGKCVTCFYCFFSFYISLLAHRSAIKADPPSQRMLCGSQPPAPTFVVYSNESLAFIGFFKENWGSTVVTKVSNQRSASFSGTYLTEEKRARATPILFSFGGLIIIFQRAFPTCLERKLQIQGPVIKCLLLPPNSKK